MTDPLERTHAVRDIIDRLALLGDREDEVVLRDMMEAFGNASFVPAMMVPAILVVSPLSGIPGFSSLCGLTILLIATQMILPRRHLWLPSWLMRRRVNGDTLNNAMRRMERFADWIDSKTRDRLGALIDWPGQKVPQILAAVCGGAMPLLELVPFSSSILGTAVLCFSVAFLSRDGIFVVAGICIMAVASLLPVFAFNAIAS